MNTTVLTVETAAARWPPSRCERLPLPAKLPGGGAAGGEQGLFVEVGALATAP